MLACDKYKTIKFPHGITVDDGSFNPACLVAVDVHNGDPCYILTRDIKGSAADVLRAIAPDLADIAETMALECFIAGDVWSKHDPMIRIESNI